MAEPKKTAFSIIKETLGSYHEEGSRPNTSPLWHCAINPKSLGKLPVGFTLCIIDRYQPDPLWLDHILKPEYRGHPVKMWEEMERLYANGDNWRRNGGLTRLGEVNYNILVNTYGFAPTKLGGIAK